MATTTNQQKLEKGSNYLLQLLTPPVSTKQTELYMEVEVVDVQYDALNALYKLREVVKPFNHYPLPEIFWISKSSFDLSYRIIRNLNTGQAPKTNTDTTHG